VRRLGEAGRSAIKKKNFFGRNQGNRLAKRRGPGKKRKTGLGRGELRVIPRVFLFIWEMP